MTNITSELSYTSYQKEDFQENNFKELTLNKNEVTKMMWKVHIPSKRI